MNHSFSLGFLALMAGLLFVLFLAVRKGRKRQIEKKRLSTGDKAAILKGLREGGHLNAVFNSYDRMDMKTVKDLLKAADIAFITSEDSLSGFEPARLPRGQAPLSLFVLRKDREKAGKVVENYLAGKKKE